ncbi:hypothetical protein EV702DRAFT_1150333 [Suillus placidus]|uniref:Uncharacterized protein n=1 Tax=Suillus placidus TaxID=48579 RepID=A0A9P6ZJE9_9AGAM|nr:hypothetical protein EV702DRAFT_1150333 [Suillus placidus]
MDVIGRAPFKVITGLSLALVATARGCVDVEAMARVCASDEVYREDVVYMPSQERADIEMNYEFVREDFTPKLMNMGVSFGVIPPVCTVHTSHDTLQGSGCCVYSSSHVLLCSQPWLLKSPVVSIHHFRSMDVTRRCIRAKSRRV